MKNIITFGLIILTIILSSCKEDNPVPPDGEPQLNLTLEDVSCTEVWIKVSTNNLSLPSEVELYKDNSLAQSINLTSSDTILYIDSLLPDKSYSFHSVIQSISQSSNSLNVTTTDTTSHDFTWQTWTFGGEAGSCILRDVVIIDENNIWAVGEIYLLDTTGVPDPNAYNAVHWDGSQWGLKRVYFPTVCGQTSLTSYPAKAIFAFDNGEIWISSSGDKIAIIQDTLEINKFCLPWSFSINKIWGISSDDLYVVGYSGNIAHYQNGQWSRIESGTQLDLYDILGSKDESGQLEILTVGSIYGTFSGDIILKLIDQNAISLPSINKDLTSVWFIKDHCYYVVAGAALFYKHNLDDNIWTGNSSITPYPVTSVSGDGVNNVFISTTDGDILHFNGRTWKSNRHKIGLYSAIYGRVTTKDNIVSAVGEYGAQAIVTLGKK